MTHYPNGFVPDTECPRCNGHGEVCGVNPNMRSRFVGQDDLSPDDFTVECSECCGTGWRPSDEVEAIYPPDFISRFWAKVSARDPSDCWIWKGGVAGSGYGMMRLPRSRKMKVASRVSLEIKLDRLLRDGEFACHTCDTPLCVNPNHLFPGDVRENMQDASQKGRTHTWRGSRAGGKNPRAKLTEHSALEIKFDSRVHRIIATEYGVSETTVTSIKSGRVWAHLPDEKPMTQDEIDDAASDAFRTCARANRH